MMTAWRNSIPKVRLKECRYHKPTVVMDLDDWQVGTGTWKRLTDIDVSLLKRTCADLWRANAGLRRRIECLELRNKLGI